jgi:hypothetical protein
MTFSVKGITMMDFRSITLVACIAGAGLMASASASGAPDPTQYLPSSLPGYAKTQEKCLRCHTAEPMSYQPENAPRAYWESEIKRMKRIFKVKLEDSEMADIVDYMTKTYGDEKGGAVGAPKEAPQPLSSAATPQVTAAQQPAAATPAAPAVKPEPVPEPAPVSRHK